MKRLLQHWTLYGLSVILLGAGLTLFNIAEAQASTSPGSCAIDLVSTNNDGRASGSLTSGPNSPLYVSQSHITVACTGMDNTFSNINIQIWDGTEAIQVVYYNGGAFAGGATTLDYPIGCPMTLYGSYCSVGGHPMGLENWNPDTSSAHATVEAQWTSGNYIATTFHLGTPGPTPCNLISETGFTSGLPADANTVYTMTLTFSGLVSQVVAVSDSVNSSLFGGFLHDAGGKSFYDNAIDGAGFPAKPVNGVPATTVTISMVDQGNAAPGVQHFDPHFWCNSVYGNSADWFDWGYASTITPTSTALADHCALSSQTGFEGKTSDGTSTYPFTVAWTGGSDYIVAVDDAATGSGTQTIDGKTFNSYQLLKTLHNPSTPEAFDVTPTSGDAVNPHFWCDYAGTWTDWGQSSTIPVTLTTGNGSVGGCDGGAFCLSQCFVMSNWNPLSGSFWVSLAKIPVCGGRWLLQPTPATWGRVVNQFGFTAAGSGEGTCGASRPGLVSGSISQWLGAGFTLITNGPSCSFGTMQSEEAAGATSTYLSTGDTFTSDGHTYTVSLPAAINAADANSSFSPFLTILLAILTAVIGVGFFFALKALLQRLMGDHQ